MENWTHFVIQLLAKLFSLLSYIGYQLKAGNRISIETWTKNMARLNTISIDGSAVFWPNNKWRENDYNIIHLLSCFEKLVLTRHNRPFAFSSFLHPRTWVGLVNIKRNSLCWRILPQRKEKAASVRNFLWALVFKLYFCLSLWVIFTLDLSSLNKSFTVVYNGLSVMAWLQSRGITWDMNNTTQGFSNLFRSKILNLKCKDLGKISGEDLENINNEATQRTL